MPDSATKPHAGRPAAMVHLAGGFVVPVEALQLAHALEARGARFIVEGADLLIEVPEGLLTPADNIAVRRWKRHLMAIAEYQAPDIR